MWPHILNRLQNRPLDHFYTLDSRPDVFQCSNDHQSIETVRPGSTSASWQWRRAEWNWDPIGSAERSSHRLWHWGHTCAAPWRSCKCQTSGDILPERWGVNSEIPQTVQEMGQFQSVSFGKVTNQPQLSGSFGGFIPDFLGGKTMLATWNLVHSWIESTSRVNQLPHHLLKYAKLATLQTKKHILQSQP